MSDRHDEHDQEPGPITSPEHGISAGLPVNGTGEPTQTQIEATHIALFGECRRRSKIGGRPLAHDWHPAGVPIQTPQSMVMTRVCCYCAPEGVTILVRTTITEQQIATERLRHGPRLVFEQVKPQARTGIVLPGSEGFNVPPDFRG